MANAHSQPTTVYGAPVEVPNRPFVEEQKPRSEEPEEPHVTVPTTFWGLTVNLTFCGLGAGLLSLPMGMASSSMIMGVIVICVALFFNAACNTLIVYCADKVEAFDFAELVEKVTEPLGSKWQRVGKIGCQLSTFAVCGIILIIFIAVAVDVIQSVSDTKNPDAAWYAQFPFQWSGFLWAPICGLIVFPLCFLPLQYLTPVSSASVALNFFLFIYVIIEISRAASNDFEGDYSYEPKKKPENDYMDGVCVFGIGPGFIANFILNVKATGILFSVLPQYEQLENRTPWKFAKAITIAFSTLAVLFSCFAVLAYITYGPAKLASVSSILGNFPKEGLNYFAQIGIGCVCLGLFPFLVAPVIQQCGPKFKANGKPRVLLVTGLVCFSIMLPMFTTNITQLNIVNGAMILILFCGTWLIVCTWTIYRSRGQRIIQVITIILCLFMGVFSLIPQFTPSNTIHTLQCAAAWV